MHLFGVNFLHRDDVAAGLFVNIDHLLQAAGPALNEHVGQQKGEGLFAGELAGAPYGVAQAFGLLLAGEAGLPCLGEIPFQHLQGLRLAAPAQGLLKLELAVEMILDDALVAAGDENEMLDAGLAGFVHDPLDHRTVDDREHFLGHGLGGRQKAGAEAGDGEDGLADFFHGVAPERVSAVCGRGKVAILSRTFALRLPFGVV